MKKTLLALALVALSASPLHAQLSDVVYQHSAHRITASSSQQGRDALDSTYYLHTYTYTLPYRRKEERQRADDLIAQLIHRYKAEEPRSTGGYMHTAPLLHDIRTAPTRSPLVSMHYCDGQPRFHIGGIGRNYVLLRHQDPHNPRYRTLDGVEWYRDDHLQRHPVLVLRTFTLRGTQHPSPATLGIRPWQPDSTHLLSSLPDLSPDSLYRLAAHRRLPSLAGLSPDSLYRLASSPATTLASIRILGQMIGASPETDRAIALSLYERINGFLTQHPTLEQKLQLFRLLDGIPGFYAEIVRQTDRARSTTPLSFDQLIRRFPTLRVFAITSCAPGDAYLRTYGAKSKHFLLQVYLE